MIGQSQGDWARESNRLAAEIAQIVAELSPLPLLVRAWRERLMGMQDVRGDLDIGERESAMMVRIEYLQAMIVAVPPKPMQHARIDEGKWERLKDLIALLFNAQREYLASKIISDSYNPLSSEGRRQHIENQVQTLRLTSRGQNYPVHWHKYFEDMFVPFNDLFKPSLGVTAQELIVALSAMVESIAGGVVRAIAEYEMCLRSLGYDGTESSWQRIASGPADTLRNLLKLRATIDGFDAFEMATVSKLPESVLAELAWKPGEEEDFYRSDSMQGWPIRAWPTFVRPLVKVDDRYYCFDDGLLADRAFTSIRNAVLRMRPDLSDEWSTVQGRAAEDAAFRYLSVLLPSAEMERNFFYEIDGQVFECDGLFLVDEYLLVLEVKGVAIEEGHGRFRGRSYWRSVARASVAPANQARRLLEALQEKGSVELFADKMLTPGNLRRTLRKEEVRRSTIAAVSLEPFTEIASRFEVLQDMGWSDKDEVPWTASVDDLRLCADLFRSSLSFLHYLEQRKHAATIPEFLVDDELVHLGFYCQYNLYGTVLQEQVDAGMELVWFPAARATIDDRFWGVEPDGDLDQSPCQPIPTMLADLMDEIVASRAPGFLELGFRLLDCNFDERKQLAVALDAEFQRPVERRRVCLLEPRGDGLGVSIYVGGIAGEGWDVVKAKEHSEVMLAITGRERWGGLVVSQVGEEKVRLVGCHVVQRKAVPESRWRRIEAKAIEVQARRVAEAIEDRRSRKARGEIASAKIGRNEFCPCQSCRKFKRCCFKRVNL